MPFEDDPHAGDPYRGDPYRAGGGQGRCPRCRAGLAGDLFDALVCPRGCGEWLTEANLRDRVSWSKLDACEPDVGSLIDRPFPPATCNVCARSMVVRIDGGVVFDLCVGHGVWLDRGERAQFEARFAVRRNRVR